METTQATPLIDRLRERQRDLGLSDKDFAQMLGITRQAWQQYKSGVIAPSTRTLRRIAEVFRDLTPAVWDFVMSSTARKSDR